jgi:hypothetical protein
MPWASASTIAALPTDWWRHCSKWPRYAPTIWASYGIGLYQGSVTSTKLKVTGIDLFSAGDFMGDAHSEDIVLSDPGGGVYKRLVIRDDKLVGACLYGRYGRWQLVFPPDAGRAQHFRYPRCPDVWRSQSQSSGRRRP